MVDLCFKVIDGYTYVFINGEKVNYTEVLPISEFYRIETREGCAANYRVPFNFVKLENGILSVADPEYDKRANKNILKLLGVR